MLSLSRQPALLLAFLLLHLTALPSAARGESADSTWQISLSGYVKTLNFLTKATDSSSDASPAYAPHHAADSTERLRLKLRSAYQISDSSSLSAKVDYDQQASFGSFVNTREFEIIEDQTEERQGFDAIKSLAQSDDAAYIHRLYRGSIVYERDEGSLEIGRQQVPWGLGHFFSATDILNPFNIRQIEFDERDGVDAINLIVNDLAGGKLQAVHTPDGKALHEERFLLRASRDVVQYELGLIGGTAADDEVIGLDLAGNVRDSTVRSELLFRNASDEPDFLKFIVNADYNLPYNIYGLIEYHFNGQGEDSPKNYQWQRWLEGDIQQLGKNYIGLVLGHDLTPLLRVETRAVLNLDDTSLFLRPECRYELAPNLVLTLAAQLFAGTAQEEFGRPQDLYLFEAKYSF